MTRPFYCFAQLFAGATSRKNQRADASTHFNRVIAVKAEAHANRRRLVTDFVFVMPAKKTIRIKMDPRFQEDDEGGVSGRTSRIDPAPTDLDNPIRLRRKLVIVRHQHKAGANFAIEFQHKRIDGRGIRLVEIAGRLVAEHA